jgi:hypothetical protein
MIAAVVHRFWPTIAGAAVLIVGATLLWWAGFNRQPAAAAPGDAPPFAIDDPAAAYVGFARGLADGPADLDRLVEGLRKLAGAIGAREGTPPQVAVDLRVAAEHVVLNPEAAGTTDAVRASLVAAAAALERDGTGPSPLRTVAESIDRATPLAKQQDQLARFFVLAGRAVDVADGR